MKTYTINFHCKRFVSKIGGETLKPKKDDEWEITFQSDTPPCKWHFVEHFYHLRNFPGVRFRWDRDKPGLFHGSEQCDRYGYPNRRGRFIMRFEVQVVASLNHHTVVIGSLGFPPKEI